MQRGYRQFLNVLPLLFILAVAVKTNAVTLTVTPSATSNTYSGFITLNITGLTNGEKVTVQTYLDLNGNGQIDSGEPMIDAFKVMDGAAMLIGGVTNISVPFDSNPAPGAVTTSLNFVPALVMENIVGQHIFRVVSPTGNFAPVTASLLVTNTPFNQSASGIVYTNGVAQPYAVVIAQERSLNSVAGGTIADANGHYFLPLPASTYNLIAAEPNCFYDFNSAPSIVLTNGMAATNNLFPTNGTATISGNVYDSVSSNSLGGLMLLIQSGSLFAIAFTDTNGNYSAAVCPSFWKIQPSKERLSRRAYVLPENPFQVDTTTGNVSNANIALPKGTAMYYGRIVNSSNAPLANVEVDSSIGGSVNTGYDAKGYSDLNGNFATVALGDGTNYWNCSIDSAKNVSVANYIFNYTSTTTLSNNQAVQQNFVGLPVTATISGNLKTSDTHTNLTGISLAAHGTIGGLNYQSLDGATDNFGNYTLGVASGQWDVEFFTGGFSDNLDAAGYVDIYTPHIVIIPPTNAVLNFIVYPIGTTLMSTPQKVGPTEFDFTITGAPNVTYTVQYVTGVGSTNWQNLFSLVLTNNMQSVSDIYATNGPRFYRVVNARQ